MPDEIPSLPIRPGILKATDAQREVFRRINARLMEPWEEDEYSRTVGGVGGMIWYVRQCYESAGWHVGTGGAGGELCFYRPTCGCAIQTAEQFPSCPCTPDPDAKIGVKP